MPSMSNDETSHHNSKISATRNKGPSCIGDVGSAETKSEARLNINKKLMALSEMYDDNFKISNKNNKIS